MTEVHRYTTAITEFAPAKVNLCLEIIGRQPDGYHLLNSLVSFAGVGDIITITPAYSFSLKLDGPFASSLPNDTSNNIVFKAAHRLAERVGREPDIAITLNKQLPVASGLGSGSADAAAVLRGLIRLWDIKLSKEQLVELSLTLGADVPVCLYSLPAYVTGIGETVKPISSLPRAWLVLVSNLHPMVTQSVFRLYDIVNRDLDFPSRTLVTTIPTDVFNFAHLLTERRNDLQDIALLLEPEIKHILEVLTHLPGCLLSRVSGSGSACFGLFSDQEAAYNGESSLKEQETSWWISSAQTLPYKNS